MKKVLAVVLAICLMATSVPLFAAAEEGKYSPDEVVVLNVSQGTVTIRKSDGMIIDTNELAGSVVIPSVVSGVTVKSIAGYDSEFGGSPFNKSPHITMLNLPGTITEIGYGAIESKNLFYLKINEGTKKIASSSILAPELKELIVPTSVSEIEPNFSSSDKLQIKIDEKNPSFVMDEQGLLYSKDKSTLVAYAGERENNRSVKVPSETKVIGEKAFSFERGSELLQSITFSSGLEVIESSAFAGSHGLKYVSLPTTLERIEDFAFANCRELVSANIPDSTSEVGTYIFADCPSFTNASLPVNMTVIPEGLFSNTSLTSIPNLTILEEIGAEAFRGCKLPSIIFFPESLKKIGRSAFEDVKSLEQPKLPETIELGARAFAGTKLGEIFTITSGMTLSGTAHFAGCKQLKEVTVEEGVTVLPANIFAECDALSILRIPKSVTTVTSMLGDKRVSSAVFKTVVIEGYEGSAAQVYCNDQKVRFASVGKSDFKFTDMNNHWATDAIKWTYYNGFFGGTSPEKFSPNAAMTRAMFAAVLYRTSDDETIYEESGFVDVKDSAYYREAVNWAKANNIINGVSAVQFGPARDIKREEIVTMLYRYAEHIGRNTNQSVDITGFDDFSKVSKYAFAPMKWAVAEGIIEGDNNRLKPGDNASRAEVATMLERFLVEADEQ